jgi:Zn finger protein HypA/HybF involved in hydrogenase expression
VTPFTIRCRGCGHEFSAVSVLQFFCSDCLSGKNGVLGDYCGACGARRNDVDGHRCAGLSDHPKGST